MATVGAELEPQTFTYWDGVKAASPIVLGYLPIGFAFGVLARTAGLTPLEIGIMSLIVYAGSAQFIGSGLIAAGAAAPTIILTTFLVNLRHLLMSTALVPSLQHAPGWQNSLLAYGITDESFAVATSVLQGRPTTPSFMAGLQITAQSSWIAASLTGAFVGNLGGNTEALGLDFALPAMFIGLLMPHLQGKERAPFHAAAVTAAVLAVAAKLLLPSANWGVIVATVVAATLGVILTKWSSARQS